MLDLLVTLGALFQILRGSLLCENAKARPVVSFLLNLPHGGTATQTVALFGAGDTVVHQEIQHIGAEAQIVIKSCQNLQVGRFQPLAQLFLRLGHQHTELLVQLQHLRNIRGRINLPLFRRFGGHTLRSCLQQPHLLQRRFRRGKAQLTPAQAAHQRFGSHRSGFTHQKKIQKRRVAVARLHQPLHRAMGQHKALLLTVQDISAHLAASFLHCPSKVSFILHDKPDFVKSDRGIFEKNLFSGEKFRAIIDFVLL